MAKQPIPQGDSVHGAVILPCGPGEFTEFIRSLLGKPQELTFSVGGSFSIELTDLIDLYHIIDQRITTQDRASPIAFSARVVYENGSTVKLNSLDALKAYRETRPLVSTQVHLAWTYLVDFPGSPSPEKQEIELSCYASESELLPSDSMRSITGRPRSIAIASRGHMEARVSHTNRTWGADIEAHLRNFVDGKIEKLPQVRQFFYKNSTLVAAAVAVLFFMAALLLADRVEKGYVEAYWDALKPILGDSVSVGIKLDALVKINAQGGVQRYEPSGTVFMTLVGIFSFALLIYVDGKLDKRKPSFVLLTDAAKKASTTALGKYDSDYRKFWVAVLVALCVNIISSMVYDVYLKDKVLTPVLKLLDIKRANAEAKEAR